MARIANRYASEFTSRMETFQANNLYAVRMSGTYAVFSYGPHWPLFINKDGVWYENQDRYSVTTSKHRGQSHPGADTVKLSAREMLRMLEAE